MKAHSDPTGRHLKGVYTGDYTLESNCYDMDDRFDYVDVYQWSSFSQYKEFTLTMYSDRYIVSIWTTVRSGIHTYMCA